MLVFLAPHSGNEDFARQTVLSQTVEAQVEEAASTDLPLLITGPDEAAAWVARQVYLRSPQCDGPFSVLDAADHAISFGDRLARILAESAQEKSRGSVYVRDLAHAGVAAQWALRGWLERPRRRPEPRLIASSSIPPAELDRHRRFDRALLGRLSRLHIRLVDLPDPAR